MNTLKAIELYKLHELILYDVYLYKLFFKEIMRDILCILYPISPNGISLQNYGMRDYWPQDVDIDTTHSII